MDFLNPDKIINKLKLRPEAIAADFGCGSGGFTIPLAKKIPAGLVYGLDIQKEPLSALKGGSLLENISNIQTVRCDLEKINGSYLPDSRLDLVLAAYILFQTKNKNAIISEAGRILKRGGKLIVIDWLDKTNLLKKKEIVKPGEIKKIAKKLKLKLEKKLEQGKYHYGLIFKKI